MDTILLRGFMRRVDSFAESRRLFIRSEIAAPTSIPSMGLSCNDANRPEIAVGRDSMNPAPEQDTTHICVCICAYKRPLLLKRLLSEVGRQETGGLFTYSVVVVDNDEARSAEAVVTEFGLSSAVRVKYCVEPRRGIYKARNTTVANAEDGFLAIIDDDEFPSRSWLLMLFKSCNEYKVDGVLGPVKRHFDEIPPAWLERSQLYERRVNPTGMRVDWPEARTGNVLLRREVVAGEAAPFREDLRSGGDTEFFKRKIAEGRVFIWCAEAEVFETVPPERWKRTYLMRKALMRGDSNVKRGDLGAVSIAKSIVAVPLYALALPFAQLLGHHRFMTLLVKLCDHLGKLLALIGIHPIREEYV
jgi:succinoglycan biosynthesis protein ExoM